MRYHPLGRTGLFVSELCLGTMTFGGAEGMWASIAGLTQGDAERLVGQSIDAGINFLDTADVYSGGLSEQITGQALRNLKIPREDVIVATKVFGEMGKSPNSRGATRHHILDGVKASLKRLQFDHIDLYQIHGFDPATPIEETLRALDQLVRHGHVRYIGVSNWAAWQIATALGISERLGLASFASLLRARVEDGKQEAGSRLGSFDFPPVNKPRATACIDAMRGIAEAHSVSVARIALAWLLHQPRVTSVIIGAKRPQQLADNIGATQVVLKDAELEILNKVSALPPEYPGWMFEFQGKFRRTQVADAGAAR